MNNDMNSNGGVPPPPTQKSKTDDAKVDVVVTLEDLFKGKVVKITSTRNILCSVCIGYVKTLYDNNRYQLLIIFSFF